MCITQVDEIGIACIAYIAEYEQSSLAYMLCLHSVCHNYLKKKNNFSLQTEHLKKNNKKTSRMYLSKHCRHNKVTHHFVGRDCKKTESKRS